MKNDNQESERKKTTEDTNSFELENEDSQAALEQLLVKKIGDPEFPDNWDFSATALTYQVQSMNTISRFFFNRKLDSLATEHILEIGNQFLKSERDSVILGFKMKSDKKKKIMFIQNIGATTELQRALQKAQVTFETSIEENLFDMQAKVNRKFGEIFKKIERRKLDGELTDCEVKEALKMAEKRRCNSLAEVLKTADKILFNQREVLEHTLLQFSKTLD